MRIIKFRLIKDNKVVSTRELRPNGIIDCPVEWDIACQFTGLLDKHGREIYEGDIVDVGISNILSGERYLCYIDYIPANFIFRNLNKSLSTTSPLLSFNNSTMFEVIGNIYESKHLLDNNGG